MGNVSDENRSKHRGEKMLVKRPMTAKEKMQFFPKSLLIPNHWILHDKYMIPFEISPHTSQEIRFFNFLPPIMSHRTAQPESGLLSFLGTHNCWRRWRSRGGERRLIGFYAGIYR